MTTYTIEASKDGKRWLSMARFEKGQNSRWNIPFDETVAVREAAGFKEVRYKEGWVHTRVVIEI